MNFNNLNTILIIWIQLPLYMVHMVDSNSCITYGSASQCNSQSLCLWDDLSSSCICNSIIPQDVVIIMDSSGSVQAHGWEIEKTFVHDLISTAIPSSSPIGIIQFASNAWIRYSLTESQNRSIILSTVSSLQYTRGWTYMKDAVEEAIHLFETQSLNTQRRLVLITDGNPMPTSQTPCDLITDLNNLFVDVMVIGVGSSWTRSRIDCLVKRDEDIVEVDGFTNDAFEILRNETDEFLCRDVSFVLSEIKPVLGIHHPIPFVEFYNNVKDMDLSLYSFEIAGTFNGDIRSIDIVRSLYGSNWPYGTYLVIYDNINEFNPVDTTWCRDCLCELIPPSSQFCNESIYISMPDAYSRSFVDEWSVVVYDRTESIHRVVMNISYGMGNNEWILIDEGYSYELQDIQSCLPSDGSCWKQSCTVYGTPGSNPIDCDFICTDSNCQIGGDHNATCGDTGLCECSMDWCYNVHNAPSCDCVVPPINCSITLNSDVGGTGIPSGDASWSKPSGIDWGNQYTLWYELRWYTFQNDEHQLVIRETPLNQRALTLFNMEYRDQDIWRQEVRTFVDFGDNPNTVDIVDNEIRFSEWSVCTLVTIEPTVSPTPAPTLGLPPIDECTVTIRSDDASISITVVDVEWSAPDISDTNTFNSNQFNNKYKVYFTETDVFIGWSAKVHNETHYAESLNTDYNATQLMYDHQLSVKVSVVVHLINDSSIDLDDLDASFDALMHDQATVCDWQTHAPTLSPTLFPSIAPSHNPTQAPIPIPTMAPTYSWWVLQECVIQIIAQNNRWIVSWTESDPEIEATLPNQRRIYVMMDGIELFIINPNQFSPQNINSIIINNAQITQIELIAQHVTVGDDPTSLAFSPHTAVCAIASNEPTLSPTHVPSTEAHVPDTNTPTQTPTMTPTMSPTYHLPIEWCHVLLLSENAYEITFKVAAYDDEYGTTPSFANVQYMIEYGPPITSHSIIANNANTDITEIIFTSNDMRITYETTQFNMTTKSRSSASIYYADWIECNVLSKAPSVNPSVNPSKRPTVSPTPPDVAVFVYSDDESICSGHERCACSVDKFNYQCIGANYPHLPQIEDTQLLFFPSSGVQMKVLLIGRYPYNLQYNVDIEWQFLYLNDTPQFNYRQRINPLSGSSTISGGEYLGEIVFAEFIPIPNEENEIVHLQYYRFEITNCRVYQDIENTMNNNYIGCGAIYPSWTYVVWVPSQVAQAILIGGGEVIPDWIFYLLLGASVTGVFVAYILFVFMKNRNLKNNVDSQNESVAMLAGIAPTTNVIPQ